MTVTIPAAIPDDIACGALLQGITAQYLCTDSFAVAPGTRVLVHAAAGGVGPPSRPNGEGTRRDRHRDGRRPAESRARKKVRAQTT